MFDILNNMQQNIVPFPPNSERPAKRKALRDQSPKKFRDFENDPDAYNKYVDERLKSFQEIGDLEGYNRYMRELTADRILDIVEGLTKNDRDTAKAQKINRTVRVLYSCPF